MGWKYWMLMGLVLVLGFIAGVVYEGSGNNESSEDPSSGLLASDESAQIGNMEITIHDSYIEETEEETYVVVDVSVVNVTDSNTQFAPMNSSIVDDEGYQYQHDSSFGDQRLIGGQIRPGGQRRGTLGYAVNDASSEFEWIYANHANNQQGAWDLSISNRQQS